jgi:hypothetical protein
MAGFDLTSQGSQLLATAGHGSCAEKAREGAAGSPDFSRNHAMDQSGTDAKWAQLDIFVKEYEQTHARDKEARIADFLPPADHPLYFDVLRELVRVDLEYGWEGGSPKSVDHYLHAYPDLQRDHESLRAIVFEEFRLRCQARKSACSSESTRLFAELDEETP